MKDIKFMYIFQHKIDKDFIYDYYTLDYIEKYPLKHNEKVSDFYSEDGYECIDRVQYSGLKDKNSVEIYNGNIVRHWAYGGGLSEVVFERCKFSINANGVILCIWNPDLPLEIVGNIYDNKDLLK